MSNVAEGALWKVAAHNEQMRTHALVVTRGKFGPPAHREKIYDPPQKPRENFRKLARLEGGYAPALAYEALGASRIEFSRMY